MKNLRLTALIITIMAIFSACQKNTGIKQLAGNTIKKTAAVKPPVCTGDTTKQFLKYINGTVFIAGVTSATDSAGDIYTAGNYSGTYDFDPGPGIANLPAAGGTFLQKLKADGTFAWVKLIGEHTGNGDSYIPFLFAVDAPGNIYISYGSSTTNPFTGNPAGDYYINKYSSAGAYLWQYHQTAGQITSAPQALGLDVYGNVYLCGTFDAYVEGSPNETISFGNIPVSGYGTFVEELNSAGSVTGVVTTHKTVQNPVFSPKGVLYDYGKNIDGTQYLRAFDHNANLIWTNQLGGNSISKLITDNAGNAIVVSGSGTDVYGRPFQNQNTQLGKYDANGNLLFRYVNCGATNVMCTNAAGNIFMEGFLNGTQDIDPTPGQHILSTSLPHGEFYIREFDGAGNFIGSKLQPAGTPAVSFIQSIAADASGYVYVSGNVNNNLFVGKYSQCY